MKTESRLKAIASLGRQLIATPPNDELLTRVYHQNKWFTSEKCLHALSVWGETLTPDNLTAWLKPYQQNLNRNSQSKKIGVINAGNIPLVGMHDFISIMISGHTYIGKNSTNDNLLLPYIASVLIALESEFGNRVSFEEKLTVFDAVIATGSNNSARYFESYFGKYPHIIRRNRNGVAVLDGTESNEDLEKLGRDIFEYYGLGCRNVSKIYVPEGYHFDKFFQALEGYNELLNHHKYMNNFDYNNAMLLLKQIPFLQNGFLIIREEKTIPSPIAVVNYQYYRNDEELAVLLDSGENDIQCVVAKKSPNLKSILGKRVIRFGESQHPSLEDYADGVDTMEFLLSLKNNP